MAAITESDVREAYAKLRALMTNATPPDSFFKRKEIEIHANLIENFWRINAKDPNVSPHLERYAEEALAEGHVELFEKAADWCKLFCVTTLNELGSWSQCLSSLYFTINCLSGNSLKLANRLAKSKHYIRMLEMRMRWKINDEKNLTAQLANEFSLLNCAPDASVTLRGLYPLILELYYKKK